MDWSLLSWLPESEKRALVHDARRRRFAKGEVVFHEGDPGGSMHLLTKGRVAVRLSTPLGDRALLRIIDTGGWFGELSALSPDPRSATILALEPCETLVVTSTQTDEIRHRIPEFDAMLVTALVEEVKRLSNALLDAHYTPVGKRLYRRLLELAPIYAHNGDAVTIPLTQDEIAQLVGTTRPTANQHLRAAAAKGVLRMRRGAVDILDPAGLERLAT